METREIGMGSLDLMDAIAGASVTDVVLAGAAGRMPERGGRRAFEALPAGLREELVRDAMGEGALEVCAERNGVTAEEQAGRVEAVLLAWRIGGSGGTVMVG